MNKTIKKPLSIILSVLMILSMLPFTVTSVSAKATADIYLLGDVNMDNDITIRDATITQLTIAGYETLNDEETYLADCNGVKGLQISDATYIQLYVARLLTDAPVNADGYKIGEYVNFNEEPTTEPTTEPSTTPTTEPTTIPPQLL